MDGQTNEQTNGQTNGRIDIWTDRQTDQQTDRQKEKRKERKIPTDRQMEIAIKKNVSLSGVPKKHAFVPKKVPLVQKRTSYLGTAQQDKQLSRTLSWDKGTFFGGTPFKAK